MIVLMIIILLFTLSHVNDVAPPWRPIITRIDLFLICLVRLNFLNSSSESYENFNGLQQTFSCFLFFFEKACWVVIWRFCAHFKMRFKCPDA